MRFNEAGHARTVANFEQIVSFCVAYGTDYTPSKAEISITALQTKLTAVNLQLHYMVVAKTACDNAVNARRIAFDEMMKLPPLIIHALAATDASKEKLDDAKGVKRKMVPSGRKKKGEQEKPLTPDTGDGSGEQNKERTRSTAQSSYDNRLANLARLIEIVATEPAYAPHENALKVASLQNMYQQLAMLNTAVINTHTALSNARIQRDVEMYQEKTGLPDLVATIKSYVKSVYGLNSKQYRQLSRLQFNRPK